jgi:hypothetical protein
MIMKVDHRTQCLTDQMADPQKKINVIKEILRDTMHPHFRHLDYNLRLHHPLLKLKNISSTQTKKPTWNLWGKLVMSSLAGAFGVSIASQRGVSTEPVIPSGLKSQSMVLTFNDGRYNYIVGCHFW